MGRINVIYFDNFQFKVESIKDVKGGNIHQRINRRFEILQLKRLIENHPFYK